MESLPLPTIKTNQQVMVKIKKSRNNSRPNYFAILK